MTILSPIERRAWHYRILLGVIYTLLVVGAITMLYPFLLMISGSIKSSVDIKTMDVLPAYLFSDEVLYKKFLESKHNNAWAKINIANRTRMSGWHEPLPGGYPIEVNPRAVDDYEAFLEHTAFPPHWFFLGHYSTFQFTFANARRARAHLRDLYNGDLDRFNRENVLTYDVWNIDMPIESWHVRRYEQPDRPLTRHLNDFKAGRPHREWSAVNVDGIFQVTYLRRHHNDNIASYNTSHSRLRRSFDDITLTASAPENEEERRDWVQFVCRELNIAFIRPHPPILPHFQQFLKDRKYQNDTAILRQVYGAGVRDFTDIPLPDSSMKGTVISDWKFFLERGSSDPDMTDVFAANLIVETPSTAFRKYVREKYKNIQSLNAAHGASYAGFDEVVLPIRQFDYAVFEQVKNSFRRECMLRNYQRVLDYVLLHGRGIVNTTIYCLLAIVTALTINPLAAYALSRFGLPSTYKILLFLMATMAFPVEVTMIPSFLLLRELNLLNTFLALVLPGAAHGYSIFLLKGFFDSLPRDLYESATIDGAGEWTMFWRITMAMSQPILAVLALGAFTAAYSAFMFAMIICPDRRMWTLMVHLYELQVESHQAVVYASLVIGAIPTFLVFLFCQNIIMRGIVVPTEK